MAEQTPEDRLWSTIKNALDDLEDAVRDAETLADLKRDVRLVLADLRRVWEGADGQG